MLILICYDGSADAQAAIDRVGVWMPGSNATVLVIWETLLDMMTRHGSLGMGMVGGFYGDDGADAAIKQAALNTAVEGAQRAVAAGLVTQPRISSRRDSIGADILVVADEVDADVIVLGTRGLSAVKSLMLGSVSHAVVHHADRAVLVVPSPGLAEQRHQWANHVQVSTGVA